MDLYIPSLNTTTQEINENTTNSVFVCVFDSETLPLFYSNSSKIKAENVIREHEEIIDISWDPVECASSYILKFEGPEKKYLSTQYHQ